MSKICQIPIWNKIIYLLLFFIICVLFHISLCFEMPVGMKPCMFFFLAVAISMFLSVPNIRIERWEIIVTTPSFFLLREYQLFWEMILFLQGWFIFRRWKYLPQNDLKPFLDLKVALLFMRVISFQQTVRYFGTQRQTDILLRQHYNKNTIFKIFRV